MTANTPTANTLTVNALRRLAVVGVAVALMLGGGVVGIVGLRANGAHPAAPTVAKAPLGNGVAAAARSTAQSDAAIDRAQQRLRLVPGDYATWATLGAAYLERARVTADPSYYPKAEGALRQSLQLRPAANSTGGNPAALAGLGALANARHDFAGAAGLARQALATDPYQADAYGVLTDALTQLGDAAGATDAVQHMLDLRPGLAALTRASYDLEQHGRLDEAQTLMTQALQDAVDPSDVAFCRYQLGELAWQAGRLADAEAQYAAGRAADPGYLPLREGQAKVAAARGQTDAALADYAELTQVYPAPAYFLEYAELLCAVGRAAQADAQLALAAAAQRLFTVNGGTDDLTAATIALAQGRPADAVRLATAEWGRRHFADVADTLGWALHADGQDAAALTYARQANALGARNARYSYHLGMIERALGDSGAARADLAQARGINPDFSPLDGPVLRGALPSSMRAAS
jgi:tetratricopeptide (TPR) repeat protein